MNMNDWMKSLKDSLTLSQVCMPGSHDASLYKEVATAQGIANLKPSTFICQDRSILEQCKAGSRFYDIRLTGTDCTVRGYHTAGDSRGITAQGGLGASFEQILQDVGNFLKANPSEFVILRISHTHESVAGGKINIVKYLNDNVVKQNIKLYKQASGTDKNLVKVPIKNFRGQLVCIFDIKEFSKAISPDKGIHVFSKYPVPSPFQGQGIVTCGEFSNEQDMVKVEQKQNERKKEHEVHVKGDHLFQLYWTQSRGLNIETDTKGTAGAHATIGKKLVELKQAAFIPNIVLYDFVNEATSTQICQMNF